MDLDCSLSAATGVVEGCLEATVSKVLDAIGIVRPKVVICGHVHGGFGCYQHQGIPIYNVSVVDESYRLVNAPTVIDLPDV